MPPELRIIGILGMPEVKPGDDLAELLMDAAHRQDTPIEAGDVLVVTQKVVSKAEDRDIAATPGTRRSSCGKVNGWCAWTGE